MEDDQSKKNLNHPIFIKYPLLPYSIGTLATAAGIYCFSKMLTFKFLVTIAVLLIPLIAFSTFKKLPSTICSVLLALALPVMSYLNPQVSLITFQINSALLILAYIISPNSKILDIFLLILNALFWKALYSTPHQTLRENQGYTSLQTEIPYLNYLPLINPLLFLAYKHKTSSFSLSREAQITELTKKSESLQRKLQDTQSIAENFLKKFSYEIKDPLDSLLGNLELVQEEHCSSEAYRLLRKANINGQILSNFLLNILDAAKIHLKKFDLSLEPRDFQGFIESFWLIASDLMKTKELMGSLYISKSFPSRIVLDRHRVLQILLNLVLNSLRHTKRGQIKIFMSFKAQREYQERDFEPAEALHALHDSFHDRNDTEENIEGEPHELHETIEKKIPTKGYVPRETEVQTTKDPSQLTLNLNRTKFPYHYFSSVKDAVEGFLKIEIVDTGSGMQEELSVNRVAPSSEGDFSLFDCIEKVDFRLWIVKEICNALQGDMRVDSKPGIGTSVVCLFRTVAQPDEDSHDYFGMQQLKNPMEQVPASKRRPILPRLDLGKLNMGGGMNVNAEKKAKIYETNALLIENSEHNLEIYVKMLKKENVTATACKNGEQALNAFKNNPEGQFLLIIIDLQLSGMSGIEVAEKIRNIEANKGWKETPIFMIGGFVTPRIVTDCTKATGKIKASGILRKPIEQKDFQEICAKIRMMCSDSDRGK